MDAESPSGLPGVPDAFQRLWTPHRMVYIDGENKPSAPDEASCPFCRAPATTDAEGLVVHRGETCYVVMNLYPYNPGHLLVCPYRHVSLYSDLTNAETAEFAALTQEGMRVLTDVSHPMGFNIGINQGEVAGAGIAAHLHQHIVPRWQGDSNFMPVIAQTKALPQLIEDARARLAERWAAGS
ncbi:HIT family protein [Propioniciclava sinopodophylli]|uniref:HIT family protein n=1 Tax=Propioniciclava sinopodophylli TaxID=1837344 RepID=UPI0024916437|nr:HIT domain-containing protein [Propioniciclava sinopodophylli]